MRSLLDGVRVLLPLALLAACVHGQLLGTICPNTTLQLSEARCALAATMLPEKAFFSGGSSTAGGAGPYSDVVDVYDVLSGAWSAATLSEGRALLAATSMQIVGRSAHASATHGQAFFAGGVTDAGYSATVDVYHGHNNSWTVATLSQPRSMLAAASESGWAMFAGGQGDAGASDRVDIYNAHSQEWSTASLSVARSSLAAVSVSVASKVFFAGGLTGSGSGAAPSDVVDIFDRSNRTWTSATLSIARSHLAAAAVGHKVLFAGGLASSGYSTRVDIFDLDTGEWSTSELSDARGDLAGATLDTKAIFVGGQRGPAGGGGISDRIDVYDSTTNTWTQGTMSQPRALLAAVGLGPVALLAGGQTSTVAIQDVDVFSIEPKICPWFSHDKNATSGPYFASNSSSTEFVSKSQMITSVQRNSYTVNAGQTFYPSYPSVACDNGCHHELYINGVNVGSNVGSYSLSTVGDYTVQEVSYGSVCSLTCYYIWCDYCCNSCHFGGGCCGYCSYICGQNCYCNYYTVSDWYTDSYRVQDHTSTAIVAISSNSGLWSKPASFAVYVSTVSSNSGTPSGVVTLSASEVSLPFVSSTSNVGLVTYYFSTSSLSVRTHQLVATYIGNTYFFPSTSSVLSFSVMCNSEAHQVPDDVGGCVCDSANHFINNATGGCSCDSANHFISNGIDCICDYAHLFVSDGLGGCELCVAGYYCERDPTSPATLCPAGSYCPQGSSEPTPCPAGTFNNVTGSSASSACVTCPAGSYCSLGSPLPQPCPAGQSSSAAAIASSNCSTCIGGTYCTGGSAPTGCPAGHFCPSGVSHPIECSQGFFCPPGSASPTPCIDPAQCPPGSVVDPEVCSQPDLQLLADGTQLYAAPLGHCICVTVTG